MSRLHTIIALWLTVFCLISSPSHSRQKCNSYNHGSFIKGSLVHTFENKVAIRAQPKVKSDLLARLPAGHPLTIIKTTDELFSHKGLQSHWVQVKFELEGKMQSGS